MAVESRLERWQRTGALHIATAAVVFATWVYFQLSFQAADRPLALNEVMIAVFVWMTAKFAMKKGEDIKEHEEKHVESEPESGGRHAK
jgi:hypothetical protein